jgi:hypothetical protein
MENEGRTEGFRSTSAREILEEQLQAREADALVDRMNNAEVPGPALGPWSGTPNYTSQHRNNRTLEIMPNDFGFRMVVGCINVAVSTHGEAIKLTTLYIMDPEGVERALSKAMNREEFQSIIKDMLK